MLLLLVISKGTVQLVRKSFSTLNGGYFKPMCSLGMKYTPDFEDLIHLKYRSVAHYFFFFFVITAWPNVNIWDIMSSVKYIIKNNFPPKGLKGTNYYV